MLVTADARCSPYNIQAHLVYADPPTNRGVNEGNSSDRLSDLDYQIFALAWLNNAIAKMAYDSRLVICLSAKLRVLYEHLIYVNFRFLKFEQEIIWHYEFGLYTHHRFVNSHDNILVFKQGRPPFNWQDVAVESQRQRIGDPRADERGRTPSDVWSIPRIPGNSLYRYGISRSDRRSCQPETLCKRILLAYTHKHHVVYDLFCGSGSMAVVAKTYGRKYYGLDICEYYVKGCIERVKKQWMRFV